MQWWDAVLSGIDEQICFLALICLDENMIVLHLWNVIIAGVCINTSYVKRNSDMASECETPAYLRGV